MNYVTCNYQGRLGNLLFEIAATLATAWKNNATPCFPKNYNEYYLDIPAFQEYILPIVSQFKNYSEEELTFETYHEPADFAYRDIAIEQNVKLNGFFTTSRYFNEYRRRIIDLFRLNTREVSRLFNDIPLTKANRQLVSVHVRRSDYVTDYGWDLPIAYYKKASQLFENAIFVIFSDDQEWCKNHLHFMEDKVFIHEKDYLELQLMGMMDAHIIANSTFSAMGVILGDPRMDKKVIAPAKWTPGVYNKDIYEPHWILI